MKYLRYYYFSVFYNFYRILKKIDSDEMPQTGALFLLVVLETLNLLVLLVLFSDHILTLNLEWISNNSRLTSLPGFIFLAGTNYFIFLRGKRYQKIERLYSAKIRSGKVHGKYITITYIVISLVTFIYFVLY